MGLGNCCLLVLAILIPPLAVILQGGCTIHLCINLICCLLGVVPGIIHAIWYCFYYEGHEHHHHHHHGHH